MVNGILVVFTTAAVCMDLNQERIDNRLIGIGWFLGCVYQVVQNGLKGVGLFFVGAFIPIALLYVLFWFRMMGAGDIKLLSAVGGFMGPWSSLMCVGLSLVFGAILSVAILILCGNFSLRLRYFADYISHLSVTGKRVPYMEKGFRMEHIHFSVPVLMAVLVYVGGFY